jgi:hypothetical protein
MIIGWSFCTQSRDDGQTFPNLIDFGATNLIESAPGKHKPAPSAGRMALLSFSDLSDAQKKGGHTARL